VENTLVEFIGAEHFVRRVAMQKKCLKEQRQEPMGNEEN
jgi:hypothetical protein